jgi:hypothetical protein
LSSEGERVCVASKRRVSQFAASRRNAHLAHHTLPDKHVFCFSSLEKRGEVKSALRSLLPVQDSLFFGLKFFFGQDALLTQLA